MFYQSLVHRTKEGDEMLVSQMDDSHLINTMKVFLRKLSVAKRVIDGGKTSGFMALLEGEEPGMSEEAAARYVQAFQGRFPVYFLELSVRGLHEEISVILDEYRKVIGRTEQKERFNQMFDGESMALMEPDEDPLF